MASDNHGNNLPSVANWIPELDGPLPTSGGVMGGSTVNQGIAAVSPSDAWHVKPTDAAGVNQAAITAAGDQKVTLDGEVVGVTEDATAVKYARINCTAAGTTTVIAAVGGKKIRVLGYAFTTSLAMTVTIIDSVDTLAGAFDLVGGGGIVYAGPQGAPALQGGVGNPIQFTLSATGNVRGHITYLEI